MPRLSTSPRVKSRIRVLLKKLLEFADPSSPSQEYSPKALRYRWIDQTTYRPKLVIKTKLTVLVALIASESTAPVSKAHIREVLLVLQTKLNILEDNRIKTQGSDVWDFTLKLWHTSVDRNLSKFDQLWAQYKTGPNQKNIAASSALDPKLIQEAQALRAYPLHNLTLRPDSHFIDSQSVLQELLTALAKPQADAIISIVGPGGIGKTTLALEAAHRCLASRQQARLARPTHEHPHPLKNTHNADPKLPRFDVIIFASAQPTEFLGPHLSERWQADRTLKDIIREILRTVDCAEGTPFRLEEQIEYVYSILRNLPTLLILDNLETVENPNRLLSFIRTLPQTVKVILTSRTRFGVGKTLSLEYLAAKPGFALITHQAKKKQVSLKLPQIKEIYQLSEGLPLAMAYSVGYLAVHRELPMLRRSQKNQPPSEIAQYCVESSLEQLKDEPSYYLLMAATLFAGKFSAKAAAHVASLSPKAIDSRQEFSSLHRLSLIKKLDSVYYSMHAFTQDFVRSKLELELDFKQSAQERWIAWHLELLKPFADESNWSEWQDYTEIEAEWHNIRAFINWCIEAQKYQTLKESWECLQGFTLIRGYWDERQEWMDSLIKMSQQQEDFSGLAQSIFYKAQTLVHLDETDASGDALQMLQKAWKLSIHSDPDARFKILNYMAAIHLKRNQFDTAKSWLDKGKELSASSEFSTNRQQCLYYYYTAEMALRQKKYPAAEEAYRKALTFATVTSWKKMMAYTTAWLATTLLRKGDLDESEHLIFDVLEAAKEHKDKRSVANCYCNLALLFEAKKQVSNFYDWARLAKHEFEKLGMTVAASQMKTWLDNGSSDS